jgi:actin-related protein 3
MNLATVVIDNGTGFSKMGYAGNMEPSYLIPTVFGDSLNKQNVKNASQSLKFDNPELDFYIGEEAELHSKTHPASAIIRGGQIENWEAIEKYWHKSIY